MPRFANESALGRARAAAFNKPERQPEVASTIVPAPRVDPSVRLGAIQGEPNGSVPLDRTMAKPTAYIAKKGSP